MDFEPGCLELGMHLRLQIDECHGEGALDVGCEDTLDLIGILREETLYVDHSCVVEEASIGWPSAASAAGHALAAAPGRVTSSWTANAR